MERQPAINARKAAINARKAAINARKAAVREHAEAVCGTLGDRYHYMPKGWRQAGPNLDDAGLAVGDRVAVAARGRWRIGVIESIGTKMACVAYVTAPGGYLTLHMDYPTDILVPEGTLGHGS